jgi:hypothetical protein
MASWTVEATKYLSSGLENCCQQSAAVKAPMMWVHCSGKSEESHTSSVNPIDLEYSDHRFHTLVSLSFVF